jgi:hypothetical protein
MWESSTETPFWDTNTATTILSDRDAERIGRSGGFGGRKDREDEKIGRAGGSGGWEYREDGSILSSTVMNLFLQLHINCVNYHSGDYHTERQQYSVVQIYITCCSSWQKSRHKHLSGTRAQLLLRQFILKCLSMKNLLGKSGMCSNSSCSVISVSTL